MVTNIARLVMSPRTCNTVVTIRRGQFEFFPCEHFREVSLSVMIVRVKEEKNNVPPADPKASPNSSIKL